MDGKLRTAPRDATRGVAAACGWFVSGMAVVGVCLVVPLVFAGRTRPAAKPPAGSVKKASATEPAKTRRHARPPTPVPPPRRTRVAAIVNNEPITREDLARECLVHYGADVLESMVNRTLDPGQSASSATS